MRVRRTYLDKICSCLSLSFIGLGLFTRAAFAQEFRDSITVRSKRESHTSREFSFAQFGLLLFCMSVFSGLVHAQGFGKIVGTVTGQPRELPE